jgi:hypothetical protein
MCTYSDFSQDLIVQYIYERLQLLDKLFKLLYNIPVVKILVGGFDMANCKPKKNVTKKTVKKVVAKKTTVKKVVKKKTAKKK